MEDYVFIIDHLPEGRADLPHHRREPVAYGLGETQFTLLELIPKHGVNLLVGDRVYIGKDLALREHVEKVNEERFVKFFNEAPAISTRFHALELLPGLGKKTMTALIDERRKSPFKSFADITERVPSVHHPEKLVANRIELELTDPKQKYHIFARPPMTEDARPGGFGGGPRGPPRGAMQR